MLCPVPPPPPHRLPRPAPPCPVVRCAGQQIAAAVTEVDVARSRLSLSLRQLQADPLQETIENLEWGGSMDEGDVEVLPEVTGAALAPATCPAAFLTAAQPRPARSGGLALCSLASCVPRCPDWHQRRRR